MMSVGWEGVNRNWLRSVHCCLMDFTQGRLIGPLHPTIAKLQEVHRSCGINLFSMKYWQMRTWSMMLVGRSCRISTIVKMDALIDIDVGEDSAL